MQAAPHFPWLYGLTYAQTDQISFTLRRDVNPHVAEPDPDLIIHHCLILPIVNYVLTCPWRWERRGAPKARGPH